MRFLLTVCIVFTVSVALASAACARDKLHIDFKTRARGCMHEGTLHDINTEWNYQCDKCTCSQSGLECCNSILVPVGYDREACESILDEETCTYKVTRKDNPSISCQFKSVKLG